MVQNMHGMHHLSKRRRFHKDLEEYPHPDPFKRLLDKVVNVVTVIAIILSVPQIIQVWASRQVSNLNLLTWGFYVIGNIVWLVYGFAHKDRAVIISSIGWFFVNALIALAILVYR